MDPNSPDTTQDQEIDGGDGSTDSNSGPKNYGDEEEEGQLAEQDSSGDEEDENDQQQLDSSNPVEAMVDDDGMKSVKILKK